MNRVTIIINAVNKTKKWLFSVTNAADPMALIKNAKREQNRMVWKPIEKT